MRSRIAALDGVRGLAIVLVVSCHVQIFVKPLTGAAAHFFSDMTWQSIYVFFVLSGYLIGGLILSDVERTGRLNLVRFWARRALRTWPLYFVALAANYFFAGAPRPHMPALPAYLAFVQIFFKMNYFIESWSLSVEELFYFVLPIAVVLSLWFFRRAHLWLICVLMIAMSYVARERTGYLLHPATTFDSLFIGVLLADLERRQDARFVWLRQYSGLLLAGGCALWLILSLIGLGHTRQYQGYLGIASGMVVLSALNPTSVTSKLFSLRLWYPLSLSSYSIYLSHMFVVRAFASAHAGALVGSSAMGWAVMAIAIVAAVAFGWVVAQAIEFPTMRLRERLVPRSRIIRTSETIGAYSRAG